jgi:hypothetical protein
MELKVEISELFEAVARLEGVEFVCDEEYYVKSAIKLKDENGHYQPVPFLMTKEDVINVIEFDDGTKVETAEKHKLAYNKKDCKFVNEFNIGDSVEKADGSIVKITKSTLTGAQELVYDLNIATDTHLYQDAQGFIHHNTAHMMQVANNLDLHFIHIDVSTLHRESTTGIPTANQAKDANNSPELDSNGLPVMTTSFSKPELLDLIQKKMQETLKNEEVIPEEKRKKGQGKYKFLLLLDELTRADAQVFNSIRKLLLEKSFNEEFDLPVEIMVAGALNPDDAGVGELTSHTRDVVDIIPARASWASLETYLLSNERPKDLELKMGFDCNTATVGAIKTVLSHYQSTTVDWRGNDIQKEEKLFNLRNERTVVYLSPREITDIVSMTNVNIINRLTVVGLESTLSSTQESIEDDDDWETNALNNSDERKVGKFNLDTSYSDEDFDIFIDAMVNEFHDAWSNKLTFTCKKQQVPPDNFLDVTGGFIRNNDSVKVMYEGIKTRKVEGVKTISEIFNAYYDDPEQLYDSPHFDNYLTANLTSPQKFVQEITDFVADKIVENQKSSGTAKFVNAAGEVNDVPMLEAKTCELYVKYLKYIHVILNILTDKAAYAGKVKEAERTNQYLSNLYISLKATCDELALSQNLMLILLEDYMDAKITEELDTTATKIREILVKFGLKRG